MAKEKKKNVVAPRVPAQPLGPGSNLSNQDLESYDLRGLNLSDSNLAGANLQKANLSGASLASANLSGAFLQTASLVDATLNGANLSNAYVQRANLEGSYLRGANLTGANLAQSNLQRTNLEGANLTSSELQGAKLGSTVIAHTSLAATKGLALCEHLGPSIIDFETLSNSWPLPLQFLRGLGLPDGYIEYLPSLCGKPINFYSCFISYSEKDRAFVERLYADLQNAGIRCWFAPHDIQSGKKIHEQIEQAIHFHDRLLLVLSDSSMDSEWVKTEIAHARRREVREKRRILFPISLVGFEKVRDWRCVDADTGKDSAREIREYFIPTFEEWKRHDRYLVSFTRLCRDLRLSVEDGD